MVYQLGLQGKINKNIPNTIAFGKKEAQQKYDKDTLLDKELKKHPITLPMKIQTNKLANAFTKYPKKGLKGSKNANFYEFLTMGTVPYLAGSAMMMAVFNLASKFYKNEAMSSALKLGQKMALGVVFYGIGKTLSKKFIEKPLKWRYGIDVNVPYIKKIDELPEEDNKNNLVTYEYHKAYESVDFPYWNLFYNDKGENRNKYFADVAKKMGLSDAEHADQKVKHKIREKIVQTKTFSTLSSYLWAAVGVSIAMQKPFEDISFIPRKLKLDYGVTNPLKFVKLFGEKFWESCKSFVNNSDKKCKIAGRVLLGSAILVTLLGNFKTLFDFNKDRGTKSQAATSLIDKNKEKVVC